MVKTPFKSSAAVPAWGWDVDLSSDPFDLRPAAEAIAEAVDVARITHGGETPIILLGETHTSSAAHMLTRIVMRTLRAGGMRIAFGWERAEDTLAHDIRENYRDAAPAILPDDPHGREVLTMLSAFPNMAHDPLSRRNLEAYCLENRISTRFIDLPHGEDLCLFGHPYYTGCLESLGEDVNQRLPTASPLGLAIRNMYMQRQIRRHIEDVKPDAYVMSTGLAHVLGHVQGNMGYPSSMAWQFEEQNCVPVVISERHLKFPEGHAVMRGRSVHITGPATFLFPYRETAREIAVMNAFNAHSGGVIGVSDIAGHFQAARARIYAQWGEPVDDQTFYEPNQGIPEIRRAIRAQRAHNKREADRRGIGWPKAHAIP